MVPHGHDTSMAPPPSALFAPQLWLSFVCIKFFACLFALLLPSCDIIGLGVSPNGFGQKHQSAGFLLHALISVPGWNGFLYHVCGYGIVYK